MELNNKKVQLDPKLFTGEEIRFFNEIKDFRVSDCVLKYYRTRVKKNTNKSKETAIKKLIRDITLSKKGKVNSQKPHMNTFHYGRLKILINFKKKKIAWLNNDEECNTYFKVDKKKKKYLNNILNIQKGSKRIKVEAQHLTKKEQLVVKIREDLIEVYDDMDMLEKYEIRREYLELRRSRWDKRKEELWQYILDKDYAKQIEFLSEMFIQYLDKKELEEWIYNINTRDKFNKFFEIFKSSDINYVKSVHATVLETVMDYKRKVC